MLRRCCVVTVLLVVLGPGCNPPPAPPNVPRNPMAVAVSRDRIDVSWVDGSNDETSFEVERRLPGGTFELVGTVAANVVTFSDTGLDFETTYEYAVRAVRNADRSPRSMIASATTLENQLPEIDSSLPTGFQVDIQDDVRFRVTVDDPEGDPCWLRLINPPAGLMFEPVANENGPIEKEVIWFVVPGNAGIRDLIFEAHDSFDPGQRTRITVRIEVLPGIVEDWRGTSVADVTGDGRLDVIASATRADRGGVMDVGALYVWEGRTQPTGSPQATLVVPDPSTDSLNGVALFRLADVTGDGRTDILAASRDSTVGAATRAGRIFVWEGRDNWSGDTTPDAVLVAPNPAADDLLSDFDFVDLNSDGVLDVFGFCDSASVGSVQDTGALYLWSGGASLSGAVSATATMTVPGASANDHLGQRSPHRYDFADVTGDGQDDVVIVSPSVDDGGLTDVGAAYVFDGAALSGSVSPLATLIAPGAQQQRMGTLGQLRPLHVADVDADGYLDILIGAERAPNGATLDAGAVFVFSGGPALAGRTTPTATLEVPGAAASSNLGSRGLFVRELTGDSILDVVAATSRADVGGVIDAGGVYVWAGGSGLTGTVAPTATLTIPGAQAGDRLSDTNGPYGIVFADVVLDGVTDLIVGASRADQGGVVDVGGVYIWAGGASLTGAPTPAAICTLPNPVGGELLGFNAAHGIDGIDVTSDGRDDVVVLAQNATRGGVPQAGAIFVWHGGAGLSGSPAPSATLAVPNASPSDLLGQQGSGSGRTIFYADVTGDLRRDLIVTASRADVGGAQGAGAAYVWTGGPGLAGDLAPTATLVRSNPGSGDSLGSGDSQGMHLVDADEDGVLDILLEAYFVTSSGTPNAGSAFLWRGGASLTGTPAPHARFYADPPDTFGLGQTYTLGTFLGDIDGDGFIDIHIGCTQASIGGVANTGALYRWKGGSTTQGDRPQDLILSVPGAQPNDQLGS